MQSSLFDYMLIYLYHMLDTTCKGNYLVAWYPRWKSHTSITPIWAQNPASSMLRRRNAIRRVMLSLPLSHGLFTVNWVCLHVESLTV